MFLYDDLNKQIGRLRTENERDSLTGLYNRKAAEKHINELIETEHGSLILVDISEFKKINEKYGHLSGDRTLQQLGTLLQHMVLKSDIVGRVGGDKFVIFIRGDRDDRFLSERIKQIRSRITSEEFSDIDARSIRLSCGWAQSDITDNYETLFKRAEENLQLNKCEEPKEERHLEYAIQVDGKKIRSTLKETGPISGAFYQDYPQFKMLYRYNERIIKRSGRSAFILLLTLVESDGSMPDFKERSQKMEILGECIKSSLRSSDVYTRYSSTQYLIMNVDTDMRYSGKIADRVRNAFYKKAGPESTNLLLYESYPMGAENKE